MKNLSAHTIIIPTYNRHDFLQQLVCFYRSEAPGIKLLVLDSSAPEIARLNQQKLSGAASSIEYRHYASSIPMAEKLAQGLGEVTTPTVSFCADDDVVFPGAVARSVDFLNKSSDYVCSHGLYLIFRPEAEIVRMFIENSGQSNVASHAGARIFRFCQNYESLFYAVFRTEQLKQIFAEVRKIPSLHFQEFFQSIGTLILGKVNRFSDFYAARRMGPEAEPGREKWNTFYWFADDPNDVLQHYDDYCRRAFAFYQQAGAAPQLSEKDFLRAFALSHAVYFGRSCPPHYFHYRLQDLWPQDAFIKDPVDLCKELREQRPSIFPPQMREWLAEIEWGMENIHKLPAIQHWRKRPMNRMNREIARQYQSGRHTQPWRCELLPNMLWLAGVNGFKQSFNEICRYLDCAKSV